MSKTIIIGAGPSIERNNHLKRLLKSKFKGKILVTDYMLKKCLEVGITPDKYNDFWCFTVEDSADVLYCFHHDIIKKYASKINLILQTVSPTVKEDVISMGFKITEIEDNTQMQTLGNVGDITLYIAINYLKCEKIGLLGFDHSFYEIPKGFPEDLISEFWIKKDGYYLNFIYEYYTKTILEYLARQDKTVYNLSEQGSIKGNNVIWDSLENFVNE